jgi:hypothetical protein
MISESALVRSRLIRFHRSDVFQDRRQDFSLPFEKYSEYSKAKKCAWTQVGERGGGYPRRLKEERVVDIV